MRINIRYINTSDSFPLVDTHSIANTVENADTYVGIQNAIRRYQPNDFHWLDRLILRLIRFEKAGASFRRGVADNNNMLMINSCGEKSLRKYVDGENND